jgi:hypothetical protein
MVANGEKITCAGIIRKAPLIIAGAAFPAEVFVMPLAGYDIVLGIKWLGALGPLSGTWPTGACTSSVGAAPSHGRAYPRRRARRCAPCERELGLHLVPI